MTTIDYESPGIRPRRPYFAWLPAVCLRIVFVTPLVFAKTANWGFAGVLHDFGLKPPSATASAIAALNWYLPGYGWTCAAIATLAAAFVTPRYSTVCARPSKQAASIALLASLCVSLAVYLALSRTIEGGGWDAFRTVMNGISGRPPTMP